MWCHPVGDPLAPELELREALTSGQGRYTCAGLAIGLRRLGRDAAGLVRTMRGRLDRLTVKGQGGATVCEPSCYGGNGREDVPAILAASAALGHPGQRLSTAIVRSLPARTGRTLEARTVAQACLPPPYIASAGLCAVVEEAPGLDRWRAGEAWASLVRRAAEWRSVLTPEEEREWLDVIGPIDVRSGVANLRLGGDHRDGGGLENGVPVRFAPWVGQIDIRTAYSAALSVLDCRRVQPIIRPPDWHRPGGDVTGLLPGRLDVPDGMLRWRMWPPLADRSVWDRVQVETAPDPVLTATVRRILETSRAEGGHTAYRAAGRVLYGLLHGTDVARTWVRTCDMPDGAYHQLAGRVFVPRVAPLAPWCEPATASAVLTACRDELERAERALNAAGFSVVQAHTDGLIVAGPHSPLESLGATAPWAEWRVKWRGSLAHFGPGRYLSPQAGVVWSGETSSSPVWQRLHTFLTDTLDFLRMPCAS